MKHPSNETRVFTRAKYCSLLFYILLLHQLIYSYDKMASNRETRMLQAIIDYQNRRYTSVRAAAAANDVNHVSLGRRLRGGLSRAIAREPQQLLSNE